MTIVLASKNAHKLIEFRRILEPMGYKVLSQDDVNVDIEVDETGKTFEENVLLKARAIHEASGMMTVADDSGICVDVLNGEPGIYSARYGGEGHTDKERCQMLLNKVERVPKQKRSAKFVCVICLIDENGGEHYYRGECNGFIGKGFVGDNGFGYDPIFMIDDGNSMAILSDEKKDEISHRGKALRLMEKDLKAQAQQFGFKFK